MADERDDTEHTEDPTPRRLEEAIKRGDVVKSLEVSTWFTIAGGTLMLMVFAGTDGGKPASGVPRRAPSFRRNSRRRAGARPPHQGAGDAYPCRARHPILVLALAALLGNAIQHRILFSVDPIMPQLSRISPAPG